MCIDYSNILKNVYFYNTTSAMTEFNILFHWRRNENKIRHLLREN